MGSPARSTWCSQCGAKVPVPRESCSAAVRCKICHAVTRVQQRTSVVAPDSSEQAAERRQPEARTTMCGRCGLYLSVPRDERSVCCALCHFVTRVRRRPSGRLEEFLKGLIYNLMYPPEPPPPSSVDWLPASYPRVAGRKRALLVGISYTGTEHEIKGPVNDVQCMSYLLRERFGFPSDSVLVLTEEGKDPNRVPTMKNLLLAMRWLVQGCNTGDAVSLVFHFSGHASDQALCPVDFQQAGGMSDSKINETIIRPLGPGVKLHAFLDTDHSGTVELDLPYRLYSGSRTGYWQWESHNHEKETPKGTNGGLAISISGCKDFNQSSATILGSGSSVGAMTYNLIKALESGPGTTYGSLLQAIRAKLRHDPELFASEFFDIYRKPFLL